MKWNLLLLHSSRKWLLTCLMILVNLNCLLINIVDIITSFTPYSKHFFPMSVVSFKMPFASILLIKLCVITMPGRSSSRIGVMKWSNLLIVAPLKLFKCALPSIIELLNKFFLILRIWLSPTIHVFLLCFIVPAHDWLPGKVLVEFLLCVLFSFAFTALDGRMLCELFFSALSICYFTTLMVIGWCMFLWFINFNLVYFGNY